MCCSVDCYIGFIQKDEMPNHGHPARMQCGCHNTESIITSEKQISDYLNNEGPLDAPYTFNEIHKAAFVCFDNYHCDDAVSS
jgi:hypothetical protein